jgi:hypothetical protein
MLLVSDCFILSVAPTKLITCLIKLFYTIRFYTLYTVLNTANNNVFP